MFYNIYFNRNWTLNQFNSLSLPGVTPVDMKGSWVRVFPYRATSNTSATWSVCCISATERSRLMTRVCFMAQTLNWKCWNCPWWFSFFLSFFFLSLFLSFFLSVFLSDLLSSCLWPWAKISQVLLKCCPENIYTKNTGAFLLLWSSLCAIDTEISKLAFLCASCQQVLQRQMPPSRPRSSPASCPSLKLSSPDIMARWHKCTVCALKVKNSCWLKNTISDS